MEKEQWYTNKDLYEMVASLTREMDNLRTDLRSTGEAVKRYNNLREQLNDCLTRVAAIELKAVGRYDTGKAIREWGGWIIGAVSFLLLLKQSGVI